MLRPRILAIPAGLALTAALLAPAEAATYQTVCNSPNSDGAIITATDADGGTINPNGVVWPGECRSFYNGGGHGRIYVPSDEARSYRQGEDGEGYGSCVNVAYGGKFSNPINDPVGGINRYKTWDRSNCLN